MVGGGLRHVPACGLLPLGGPCPRRPNLAERERLAACPRSEGFDLPAPTQAPNDEHVFDLSDVVIDTASNERSRAVFVTCAPGSVAP